MNGGIKFRNGEAGGFAAELELPEGTHASGVLSENQHAGSVRTGAYRL